MLFQAHLRARKAKTRSANMVYLIFHSYDKTLWLNLETSPLVLLSSHKKPAAVLRYKRDKRLFVVLLHCVDWLLTKQL